LVPAPGDPDAGAVDEYPVGGRVGLLLALVFPDGFGERDFPDQEMR